MPGGTGNQEKDARAGERDQAQPEVSYVFVFLVLLKMFFFRITKRPLRYYIFLGFLSKSKFCLILPAFVRDFASCCQETVRSRSGKREGGHRNAEAELKSEVPVGTTK